MTTRAMLMRDAEGRPLSEGKAGPDRMAGVPFALRTCPYPGSRHHHARPMNLSALRQVSAHWDGVLGAVAYLRELHRQSAGTGISCIADVWRIGHMTSSIAELAFMRTWRPIGDRELPATIAAMYKVTLGVTSTSLKAWSDVAVRFTSPASVDFLIDYAERHGQLIGPDQVCGGSETMIRELLAVVVDGGASGDGGRIATTVVGDEAAFRRFCNATAGLRFLRFALERLDAALRRRLASEVGAELSEAGREALIGDLDPGLPVARFALQPHGAQLAMLGDIVGQLADERFACTAGLGAGARALLDAWTGKPRNRTVSVDAVVAASPLARVLSPSSRDQLARCAAHHVELERIAAPLARALKVAVAETLGVSLADPGARELGLVAFVPIRAGRPSMRHALREVFGIVVDAPDGDVTIAPL
ncbi:MAG: hypothetical protein M3680_00120 [Myxococcota bacterium]|nr:hypothetical protein [Myxococcota bacterium]